MCDLEVDLQLDLHRDDASSIIEPLESPPPPPASPCNKPVGGGGGGANGTTPSSAASAANGHGGAGPRWPVEMLAAAPEAAPPLQPVAEETSPEKAAASLSSSIHSPDRPLAPLSSAADVAIGDDVVDGALHSSHVGAPSASAASAAAAAALASASPPLRPPAVDLSEASTEAVGAVEAVPTGVNETRTGVNKTSAASGILSGAIASASAADADSGLLLSTDADAKEAAAGQPSFHTLQLVARRSLEVSLRFLQRTNADAFALLAVLTLLPGGAREDDLNGIWANVHDLNAHNLSSAAAAAQQLTLPSLAASQATAPSAAGPPLVRRINSAGSAGGGAASGWEPLMQVLMQPPNAESGQGQWLVHSTRLGLEGTEAFRVSAREAATASRALESLPAHAARRFAQRCAVYFASLGARLVTQLEGAGGAEAGVDSEWRALFQVRSPSELPPSCLRAPSDLPPTSI